MRYRNYDYIVALIKDTYSVNMSTFKNILTGYTVRYQTNAGIRLWLIILLGNLRDIAQYLIASRALHQFVNHFYIYR